MILVSSISCSYNVCSKWIASNLLTFELSGVKVQLYLSEVLDWYKILKEEGNWTEKTYSPTRKKLISTLENNSGYNTDILLKRLPQDTLFEERAILYGKINQHLRALSLYVHKVPLLCNVLLISTDIFCLMISY